MKYYLAILITSFLLIISACQPPPPACPPESIIYLNNSNPSIGEEVPESISPAPTPELIEIDGKMMLADKVVRGELCNDSWHGTVYVPCKIRIYEWDEEADFLQNCDLAIEPGTVVYVAAHNDDPYYKGCSCHTGEDSQ
jgi:hypothetical protein